PRRWGDAARRRARRAAARSGAAAGAAGGPRRHRPAGCRGRSRLAGGAGPRGRRPAGFGRAGRAAALTVRVLLLALSLLQHPRAERPDVRAGLDTLYGGGFPAAAAYFAELAGRDPTDPAPVTFEASAYIWWAAALENDSYEATRIDSLLDLAIARARAPGPAHDFWLATALGYRARQRDLHGHSWGAAKDGKAMRDAYARVLAVDSSCTDCYLGLGVYQYGLGRASALARLVAKIVGLGSGNAERGIAYM